MYSLLYIEIAGANNNYMNDIIKSSLYKLLWYYNVIDSEVDNPLNNANSRLGDITFV